jgi:hypothetical protein
LGWLSGIVLGYWLDVQGFKSQKGLKIFLFTRLALGPTQPPILWVPEGPLSQNKFYIISQENKDQMSNDMMGEQYEIINRSPGLILDRRRRRK